MNYLDILNNVERSEYTRLISSPLFSEDKKILRTFSMFMASSGLLHSVVKSDEMKKLLSNATTAIELGDKLNQKEHLSSFVASGELLVVSFASLISFIKDKKTELNVASLEGVVKYEITSFLSDLKNYVDNATSKDALTHKFEMSEIKSELTYLLNEYLTDVVSLDVKFYSEVIQPLILNSYSLKKYAFDECKYLQEVEKYTEDELVDVAEELAFFRGSILDSDLISIQENIAHELSNQLAQLNKFFVGQSFSDIENIPLMELFTLVEGVEVVDLIKKYPLHVENQLT